MKKIITLVCTLALMLSFSGCGIERPDLDIKAQEQSEGSDLKRFDIKDSRIRTDLSDRFHIDADISGHDADSLPSYELKKLILSEDQIAEMFMSGPGFKRENKNEGVVGYSKDKEKLDVYVADRNTMGYLSTPAISYALDKGKEYQAVLQVLLTDKKASDEAGKKAEELVKEKLGKLPVEYCDFTVSPIDHDALNRTYAALVAGQTGELPEDGTVNEIIYTTDGPDDLDKNFRFTEEDDCYFVRGVQKIKDFPLTSEHYGYNVSAVVSSRGIEYLQIDNLYTAENPYMDSPVIPVEQAADVFYKAYGSSTAKDQIEITVDRISLSYMMQESYDEGARESKTFLLPVWSFHYVAKNSEETEIGSMYCKVSASDGKLLTPESYLFSMSAPVQ